MTEFDTVRAQPTSDDACVVVIFGATGDLNKRKLIPALFRLSGKNGPGISFHILGVGKEALSTEQFRAMVYEGASSSNEIGEFSDEEWLAFVTRVYYVGGELTSTDVYREIAVRLAALAASGASPNHLFYCS